MTFLIGNKINVGRKLTDAQKLAISLAQKGKPKSEEHKLKLSLIHKGTKKPWVSESRKGKPLPLETRLKMGKSDEEHHNWKGDDVSYRSLHKWIEGKMGKANHCENDLTHTSTRYHWANISKLYKRELSDWKQLCPSCNGLDKIGRRVSP